VARLPLVRHFVPAMSALPDSLRCRFHHVGVVTGALDAAVGFYRELGYRASQVFEQEDQQLRIVLMSRDADPLVELIQPSGPQSPAHGWIKRIQAGPYHTCYAVAELEPAIERFRELGLLPVFGPRPAVAFGGARVAFLWNETVGLLELVEQAQ
jgi:catechol 2,3-dioxygenase-like lactoylglutathione lyase family enzyme